LERPLEIPGVDGRRHAVGAVESGAWNEPREADTTLDEDPVGLGALARPQAHERLLPDQAVALLGLLEDAPRVGHEQLLAVGDPVLALHPRANEAQVAGGPHGVATDVRSRLHPDHRGAVPDRPAAR